MEMILDGNTSKEAAEKLFITKNSGSSSFEYVYKTKIRSLPQLVQEYDFFKKYDLRAN